jgi:predicted Zn-dependent protease with MMP-like domain
MRGPVLPQDLPAWRSRGEKFDLLVLEAFAPLEERWHDRLTKLDIAVDEVPRITARDPASVTWPDEVVADGPVPLSRLIPAGVDRRGAATRARLVLFRRPLELRAKDPEDLVDLLHEVLVAQVATYLGVDPDVIG